MKPKKDISIYEEEEKKDISNFQKKLINVIDKLQNGDIDEEDIKNFIGSLDKLFEFAARYNVITHIDPFNVEWGDYQNKLFKYFLENDPNYVYKIIEEELSDITELEGKYYLDLENAGDLAIFFSDGRNDMSRDTIASILNGDHELYFHDATDNIYRDVYDELGKDYQQEIKNYLKEELLKVGTLSIGYKTPEVIEELAKEQGDESQLKLDEQNVTQLINDEVCLEYFLVNLGLDINQELYSLYSGCYESVYSDEIYNNLMGELVEEVIDNSERNDYKYKKYNYHTGKSSDRWGVRFDVTNSVARNLTLWIFENANNDYENVNYHGNYMNILTSLFSDGELSYLSSGRMPDYPDFGEVKQCINDNFNSYF